MAYGILYLIPSSISENQTDVIPEQVRQVIKNTEHFAVENVRTARRFISSLKLGLTIEELQFEVLDKKTTDSTVEKILKPLLQGKNVGVISESGCPGIADPGSRAVAYAHKKNIRVVPLVGPSSIFLALMASGFNGQKFAFHGYLPIKKKELETAIKQLEADSIKHLQTQIFIEAPYRNNQMLETLTKTCRPSTQICVAKDVSGTEEFIKSQTAAEWKKQKIELHKVPTVFILFSS
ncbi:SAM-dependent methyltransferase [Fulvivirga sediminis]|uniref:SAM-dependent methyltransferase n=1 Tax=Fulvivirga sediminis TaxID=2803949 RepID=A0A937F5V9_9BACT|nr:SAM-dependent methyltransferase [Fulvivirga sediminis]MBL3654673.1 SAM-dependent methyltransferase [Fulvivirga sediminis]